jgi:hypothetical protein
LNRAVDEAGDRLAEAIAEHREQWLPLVDVAATDAATRFDRAISEAREVLDELRSARGAVDWLGRFDVDLARGGQFPQFTGGRLRVKSRGGVLKGEFDPTELLDLAAKVTTVKDTPAGWTVSMKVPAHV